MPGITSGAAAITSSQIAKLKQLAVNNAAHVNFAKQQLTLAQEALAKLPAADVEAVVVPGYPPSI